MPLSEIHSYVLVHDLQSGFVLGGSGGDVSATARGVVALPELLAIGQSLKVHLALYEDQTSDDEYDPTGADVLNWYAHPNGDARAATLLGTGTVVTGSGVGAPTAKAITFEFLDTKLADGWQDYSSVRFWFEIGEAAADRTIKLWQDVQVIALDDDASAAYPASREIPDSQVSVATDTTLTAYPGRQVILVDTSAGDVVLTLFSAAEYDTCELLIIKLSAANTLTITPDGVETINGESGSQAITERGDGLLLVPYLDNWLHANFLTTVGA